MRRLRRLLSPTALVVAFSIVTVLALLIAASTSTTAFGAYNRGWDGTSELQTIGEEAGVTTDLTRTTRRTLSQNRLAR